LYVVCDKMGAAFVAPFSFMWFVIWKPKDKFTTFSNNIFSLEKDAREFAGKSIKKKIEWDVVPYNKENYDKYWYK